MRRLASHLALGFFVLIGAADIAGAQNYPSRPITLVAPFAPGGASDILARALADSMSKTLGQPVIVETRAGAGGTIGLGLTAVANPDGYTIVLGGSGSVVYAEGFYDLKYSAQKDLRPVAMVASAPAAIAVNVDLGVNSLDDLIKRAKQGTRLKYGSPGVGSFLHLAGVQFAKLIGAQMVHVSYKGLVPALTDLQAGNIPLVFANVANVRPFLESGRIKALAVTSKDPTPQLPGVPTVVEAGMPDMVMSIWYGVMAPAKTDDAIINKLNEAVAKFVRDPATVKIFDAQGYEAVSNTSASEFQSVLDAEFKQWLPMIKQLGIKQQ